VSVCILGPQGAAPAEAGDSAPTAVVPATKVADVGVDGTPEDVEERGNSAADIAAAISQGVDNSAEMELTHAQMLAGPVSAELLERIDALYAELKLEAVRDVLDESLTTEKDLAAVVQLRQFRASVLFSMGDVKGSLGEYTKCIDLLSDQEQTEETAEQINQFWATCGALNQELSKKVSEQEQTAETAEQISQYEREAEICLEEAESNGMLKKEAERLGTDIIAGYKEDAVHYDELQSTGVVPEEFTIKVKTTAAVQKVSEMEAQDHMSATDHATTTVEETGVQVTVQVPEGAVGGQQVPCQVGPGMPAHMITIPLDKKAGDTIEVKLPKLEDLSDQRLEEFVAMMSEAVDAGRKHPQLTASCLAKRAMHYLLLGKLEESLQDLGNLLSITQHKPVEEDPTAAEAYIMSGFVHRLCVMTCAMPPTKEAMVHEQKAGAAFAAAQKLGVENLQESIAMMESEIQRAPKVRAIVEEYQKAVQSVQSQMENGGKGGGSPPGSPKKVTPQVKAAIKSGSEAFDKKDYPEAIKMFTAALDMKPSTKLKKWLFKNRAVCYKYMKEYEPMLADAQQSCKLEPTVPTHYLYCAVALKQLKRTKELQEVCEAGLKLEMPATLRQQLTALKDSS
jgi:tetratricopeptide (TPR) repeat protein